MKCCYDEIKSRDEEHALDDLIKACEIQDDIVIYRRAMGYLKPY